MKSAAALIGGGILAFLLVILIVFGVVAVAIIGPEEDPDDQTAGTGSASCLNPDLAGSDEIPEEFREDLAAAAAESGVHISILAAQIEAESTWDPNAVSEKGAQGLTQFMPATWAEWGEGGDPFNPSDAIAAQARYMGYQMDFMEDAADGDYDRQITLALAGYHSGAGRVQSAGWEVPTGPRVANYVRDIPRLAEKYAADDGDDTDATTASAPASDCADVQYLLANLGDGEWIHPLPGSTLASPWGPRPCPDSEEVECNRYVTFHYGLDFNDAATGEAVRSMTDAEVIEIGYNGYQGAYIVTRQVEEPGMYFQHHHCVRDSFPVEEGDQVSTGDALCTHGTTGNSSGDHLHLTITTPDTPDGIQIWERYDYAIDPEPILREKGIL
ncbi:transglycosylase SLT domain-containing protein [Nesterenkonia sp. K-15-9-6]|uniref:transglycosylase SLT domain-containing protein n=1 Tax=Nesterenkonia sp. K-15-9-6 TaxID=3093918 RepID=UPI004043A4BD